MKLKDKLFFAAMALVIVGMCGGAMWYSLRNNNAAAFVGWLMALYFGVQYLMNSLCVDNMSNWERERNQTTTDGHNGHKPCKYRKHETINGVTLDWCYALRCELMPCEYCNERDRGNDGEDKGHKSEKSKKA